ncbi:helix-turn-helix transcriptional regulator [Niameybacter massiliensis]|uniref:Helix-turn-helix transcriptional regulator n=1 Tax=Holtiella tumoricola TaxID=3018743 RepID=A0AA42DM23_9FIRM|nr:helix-turn-helix transcriptional regulator [Holtiella tumoricola]MDA3731625.1 helix-turn-helix transcriptional regulator [Holtiella tumoricola]
MVECKLKFYRKESKLTQEELAEKVGVHKDYISMIERGKRTPGFSLSKKIADVLNESIENIFFKE